MTVPIWALLSMVIVIFNAGLAIGFFGSQFVTHKKCRERMQDARAQFDKDIAAEIEHRKEAWRKVDYLYERELSRQSGN